MPQSLEDTIRLSLENYLSLLENDEPSNLYELIIGKSESILLQEIMRRTNNNQSRAARWLGLSRNTLIKKLSQKT